MKGLPGFRSWGLFFVFFFEEIFLRQGQRGRDFIGGIPIL